MRRYLFVWIVWVGASLFAQDNAAFLERLRKRPPLSFAALYKHYIAPSPLDRQSREIEESFGAFNGDSSRKAVDFSLLGIGNIVYSDANVTVLTLDVENFYRFALLCDKNGSVRSVALIGYRKGMRDWQIERDTMPSDEKGVLWIVRDERRDAEWIVPGQSGEMLLRERRLYKMGVSPDGKWRIKPTSMDALYKQADARLNRAYKAAMHALSPKKREALRRVQRAWVRYVTLKCDTYLPDLTEQGNESVPAKIYKDACLYEATRRRADELDALAF
jgi:uncharacterized protein YecT (DUF1311 family)